MQDLNLQLKGSDKVTPLVIVIHSKSFYRAGLIFFFTTHFIRPCKFRTLNCSIPVRNVFQLRYMDEEEYEILIAVDLE